MSSEHIDTFGSATQDITDAYIVWVLTQENKFSKEDLQNEFDNLKNVLNDHMSDPYFLSLYAGSLFNVDDIDSA